MPTTIEDQVARYSRAVTTTARRASATAAPALADYARPTSGARHPRAVWAAAALFVLLVALAAGALASGGSSTTDFAADPDADQAAAAYDLLDQAVAAVNAGQADELCSEQAADPTVCQHIYEDLDPRRVPVSPPHVAATQSIGAGEFGPGYILTVCGLDGLGEAYVTDLQLVSVGGDAFAFVTPIYWSGIPVVVPASGSTNGTVVVPASAVGADTDAALPAGCPTAE